MKLTKQNLQSATQVGLNQVVVAAADGALAATAI